MEGSMHVGRKTGSGRGRRLGRQSTPHAPESALRLACTFTFPTVHLHMTTPLERGGGLVFGRSKQQLRTLHQRARLPGQSP